MKNSIMQTVDECYVCRKKGELYIHHAIFGTANRKLSDKYGLTVKLCREHHVETNGVHGKNGHDLDLYIRQMAQRAFEEKYGHDKWMNVFQKNYL